MKNAEMKNVYVWGNGQVSKWFLQKAVKKENVNWGGNICSNSEPGALCYKEVVLDKNTIIIIATSDLYTDEILNTIINETELSTEQVIALAPTTYSKKLGVSKKRLHAVLENAWSFIRIQDRTVTTLVTTGDFERECIEDLVEGYEEPLHDYVRINAFDLCANEIIDRNIQGEVAELGVFQGDFAMYINRKFPERKLYLFDTFEGFSEEQLVEAGLQEGAERDYFRVFADTSESRVLSKMYTPENCIIKKGYFPETLQGLEEKFAFVSLDADLRKPIYEGLKYFYPRLSEGGYIFIHDYNQFRVVSDQVRAAIKQYEQEYGYLHKIPIPDRAGTLCITK